MYCKKFIVIAKMAAWVHSLPLAQSSRRVSVGTHTTTRAAKTSVAAGVFFLWSRVALRASGGRVSSPTLVAPLVFAPPQEVLPCPSSPAASAPPVARLQTMTSDSVTRETRSINFLLKWKRLKRLVFFTTSRLAKSCRNVRGKEYTKVYAERHRRDGAVRTSTIRDQLAAGIAVTASKK